MSKKKSPVGVSWRGIYAINQIKLTLSLSV